MQSAVLNTAITNVDRRRLIWPMLETLQTVVTMRVKPIFMYFAALFIPKRVFVFECAALHNLRKVNTRYVCHTCSSASAFCREHVSSLEVQQIQCATISLWLSWLWARSNERSCNKMSTESSLGLFLSIPHNVVRRRQMTDCSVRKRSSATTWFDQNSLSRLQSSNATDVTSKMRGFSTWQFVEYGRRVV